MKRKDKLPSLWRAVATVVLGALLGGRVRHWLYRRVMGYNVDGSAKIGICFIRVVDLTMARNSRIGHFTIIRNVQALNMGVEARIGTFNWVFGMVGPSDRHFVDEPARESALIMHSHSSVTSRHIIDCTNRVEIGSYTTVAGFRSQILSHGIDLEKCRQASEPVKVSEYCLIGSGCIILKGAIVPAGSVVGAGSVFRGQPEETHCLYSGVPATRIRSLSPDLLYFRRELGPVD